MLADYAQDLLGGRWGKAQVRPDDEAQRYALKFFQDAGWSPAQATGIVANLIHESNLDPTALGDNGESIGIAQWQGPRRQKLLDYAQRNKLDPYSLEGQLQYINHEMQTAENKAGAMLRQAQNKERATQAFSRYYERPGKPMMGSRLSLAQKLWKMVGPSEAEAAEIPPHLQKGDKPELLMDYAKSLLQGSEPAPTPATPKLIAEDYPGQERPTGGIIPGSAAMQDLAKAAMVEDPETKFRILAAKRFPGMKPEEAAKRYFIQDGRVFFINEKGEPQPEAGATKELIAKVLGQAPEAVGGLIGEYAGGPLGAGVGAAAGGQLKEEFAEKILGAPAKPVVQRGIEAGLEGVTGAGGAYAGRLIGKGINRFMRRGTGKVGKILSRDVEYFDRADAARIAHQAKRYGIDLTAPEITNSPTMRAVWANLAKTPGPPAEKIGRFFQEIRNPQVMAAIQAELGRISPVDDIFRAGGMAREGARGILGNLEESRRLKTTPLYQKAFESGAEVDVSPVLDKIDDLIKQQPETGTGLTALNKAKRLLQRATKTQEGKEALIPETRLQQLQGVKEELDTLLKRTQTGEEAIPKKIHRNLTELKNLLLEQMDAASPEYAQARRSYEALSKPINDLLYGSPKIRPKDPHVKTVLARLVDLGDEAYEQAPDVVFRASPEAIKRTRAYFQKQYPEAWDALVRSHLQKRLESVYESIAVQEGNFGYAFRRKVMGTAIDRHKLKMALSPDQYRRLSDFMEVLDQTTKIVYSNSQTAFQLATDQILKKEAGGPVARMLQYVTPSPYSIGRNIQELRHPAYANALTDALLDPANTKKILRLRQLGPSPKKALEVSGFLSSIYTKAGLEQPTEYPLSGALKDSLRE